MLFHGCCLVRLDFGGNKSYVATVNFIVTFSINMLKMFPNHVNRKLNPVDITFPSKHTCCCKLLGINGIARRQSCVKISLPNKLSM